MTFYYFWVEVGQVLMADIIVVSPIKHANEIHSCSQYEHTSFIMLIVHYESYIISLKALHWSTVQNDMSTRIFILFTSFILCLSLQCGPKVGYTVLSSILSSLAAL